jgi:glycosyltransferase involved in cell wall biosynthesis
MSEQTDEQLALRGRPDPRDADSRAPRIPTVSVIVPSYNHARFLRRRIDTILSQTFQAFEVILLDDCSTDGSQDILTSYGTDSRVRINFNKNNSGSTFKQWNKGVRMARGKYVWIAESDDYADESLLERLVQILDGDEKISFAFCRSWRVTDDDQLKGFEDSYSQRHYQGTERWDADFCVEGEQECRGNFLFINPVPNASAVVFRRVVYERVGAADESMILCGDWKLWAAMALAGRMAYSSRPLNYYRFHDATLRNRTAGRSMSVSVPESLRAVRWILDRVNLTEAETANVYTAHAYGWVPELLSTHIPLRAKLTFLRHVRAADPHPMRRVAGPAIETVRRKLLRHWRDFRGPSQEQDL